MNIVNYLLSVFFKEEIWNTGAMILTSFMLNILQTNGISYITATIIDSLQKHKYPKVTEYFNYFIAISIIYIILYNFYKYFQNKLLTKLRQWMRHQLIKMLLLVNNENLSEINFNKLNSPINRISSVSFMAFNDMITYILPNITFLLIVAMYFLYKSRLFGAFFIAGNMVLFFYLYLIWTDMLEHNEEYEKGVSENEAYLMEMLNNIDKIIYRGQTQSEIEIFSDKTNNSINTAFTFYSNTTFHGSVMIAIVFSIILGCIFYLIRLYFQKKIDMTTFITFFTILLLYRDKMMTVIQQVPDFIEFLGRSDAVLKHFNTMADDIAEINNKTYSDISLECKQIRFENLAFQYKANKTPLFQNLNITMNTDGRVIGITGLSGNGKSTLMKLVLKLYRPTEGTIYIDGQDIQHVDADYIRSQITYVNQNSKLFDKKIVDNMLYGCSDLEHCNHYLSIIMKYPKIQELYKNTDIYTKQSGSLGENLSGGQRQVVNMIGGLVNPSKILILDEPTNALDPSLKKELLGLLRDFKKEKQCIIIITHDRDVYPLFDETIQI